MKIAFDVDDTLIIPAIATGLKQDTPNYETIAIYKMFQNLGFFMVIWSGCGTDYARMWADKLGLIEAVIIFLKRVGIYYLKNKLYARI